MSTVHLLQLFGIAYLATGLGVFISPSFYRDMFEQFIRHKALVYLSGFAVFTLGFVLVSFYNVWEGWNILIALFGWIALVEGALILVLPQVYLSLVETLVPQTKRGLYWAGFFALVLGAVFAYGGFIAM